MNKNAIFTDHAKDAYQYNTELNDTCHFLS